MRSLARTRLNSLDGATSLLDDLRGDCEAHRAVRIHPVIDQNQLPATQIFPALDLRRDTKVRQHSLGMDLCTFPGHIKT